MPQVVCRELIVRGRVQRVGFRIFVRDVARAFDISGSVRNAQDGSVHIAAQGTEPNMRAFIEQIEIGSPSSRVDELEIREVEESRRWSDFRVVE